MKKILYTMLLISISAFLKAQDGVFLTYEDFKANKIQAADEGSLSYNFGTTGYVSIKQNGNKIKYKLDDIYAMRKDDECWRALHCKACKDGMAVIEEVGNYIYYFTKIAVPHNDYSNGRDRSWEGSKMHYFVSKTLSSTVYEFTPHLESLDDLFDAHKDEFKELKPFLDKAVKKDRAEEVLQKCIKASPEYKLPDPLPKSRN
jgi:hypothetical protein